MRATVRDLFVNNGALTALVPSERWFQAGDVKDVPRKPFVILRWLSPVRSDSGSDLHQLQVAAYDERGSYQRIDRLLGGPFQATPSVYSVLAGVMGTGGLDGYVAEATYLGHSGDQEDIDYKANMKFLSWQIIGRIL